MTTFIDYKFPLTSPFFAQPREFGELAAHTIMMRPSANTLLPNIAVVCTCGWKMDVDMHDAINDPNFSAGIGSGIKGHLDNVLSASKPLTLQDLSDLGWFEP